MSDRQQKEADRLWRMMQELGKEKATPANQAFLKREAAALKAAYEKVTGVIANAKSDAAKSKAKSFGSVFGGRLKHETADSLHDHLRDSKKR